MDIRYNALYLDLLDDLSAYLPSEVVDFESATQAVYKPDISLKEFRALHLAKSFFKKFKDTTSETADQEALDKFLQSNLQCKNWELRVEDLKDELLTGLFRQQIWKFFNPTDLTPILSSTNQLMEGATTGPGASLGAKGTDFYTKLFSGPLTCTRRGIYEIYSHYNCKFPEWSRAEEQRIDDFGEYVIVAGNRLSFVPKNVNTSRVICTEPLLNMYIQQGFRAILERRLKQFFGIDLATQQDCNRDLAQIGSQQDSYVTIDLSSASDTVSMGMVEEFFPSDIVRWIKLLRSPICELPDGSEQELHMMSSMGNAFTFPIETIIFSCVVSACYRAMDIPLRRGYSLSCKDSEETGGVLSKTLPNFGVFGDDIIARKDTHKLIMRLLTLLGFSVNTEKSFTKGPFRESCGGDFFNGHLVRGVYIKSLKTPESRYVAINRLNQWSAVSNIPLTSTVGRLLKSVRYLPIPLYENDDAGVKVPLSMLTDIRRDQDTGSYLYRRWMSRPKRMRFAEGGITVPRGAKRREYNPHAALLAFLRGDIRSCSMSIRLGTPVYRTKVAISPNWDWLPTVGDAMSPIGSTRFAAAIYLNFMSK